MKRSEPCTAGPCFSCIRPAAATTAKTASIASSFGYIWIGVQNICYTKVTADYWVVSGNYLTPEEVCFEFYFTCTFHSIEPNSCCYNHISHHLLLQFQWALTRCFVSQSCTTVRTASITDQARQGQFIPRQYPGRERSFVFEAMSGRRVGGVSEPYLFSHSISRTLDSLTDVKGPKWMNCLLEYYQ